MEYKFSDAKNTAVITTKDIIHKKKDILIVTHDSEDGMWQFLDGSDVTEDDAAVVSLYEMTGIDGSINELYDLPFGWRAFRNNKSEKWTREHK